MRQLSQALRIPSPIGIHTVLVVVGDPTAVIVQIITNLGGVGVDGWIGVIAIARPVYVSRL